MDHFLGKGLFAICKFQENSFNKMTSPYLTICMQLEEMNDINTM